MDSSGTSMDTITGHSGVASGNELPTTRERQKTRSQYRDNALLARVDGYFHITKLESTFGREILGGIASFLASSYILSVHPPLMAQACMDEQSVLVVTALMAGLGSIAMGLIANFPAIIAPGLGANSFFVFFVVQQLGQPWQAALTLVVFEGLLVAATAMLFRQRVLNTIPESYRMGLGLGLGIFIALVGAQFFGLTVSHPVTGLTFGDVTEWKLWLGISCLVLLVTLLALRVRIAFIIVILTGSAISLIIRGFANTADDDPQRVRVTGWGNLGISKIAFQLNADFNGQDWIYLIPVMTFRHLFDSIGTLLALIHQLVVKDECYVESTFKSSMIKSHKLRKALMVDGIVAAVGGLLGTSTTTSFIESSVGIATGARSGLAAIVAGLCFILSIFISPLVKLVSLEAIGPALIGVCFFQCLAFRWVEFDHMLEAFSACVAAIAVPFAYDIGTGASIAFLFYVLSTLIGHLVIRFSPHSEIEGLAPITITLILLGVLSLGQLLSFLSIDLSSQGSTAFVCSSASSSSLAA